MKFGLILFVLQMTALGILLSSCTSDSLEFSEEDTMYLGAILYIKSNNGTVLDQSPQDKPYWTKATDTLRLQAQVYEFNETDTTHLKNLWYQKVKTMQWQSPDGRLGEQSIIHIPDSSSFDEWVYHFYMVDLNGDTLRDSLRLHPLKDL